MMLVRVLVMVPAHDEKRATRTYTSASAIVSAHFVTCELAPRNQEGKNADPFGKIIAFVRLHLAGVLE